MLAGNCRSGSELMLSDTRHLGREAGAAMSSDGPCASRGQKLRLVEFVPSKERLQEREEQFFCGKKLIALGTI